MSLSTMNIANLIDINNEILSVKDILKAVNYNVNDIYIDKFWDSIQNDKWIYIDNVMLSWMGYNRNEIKKNKQDYMNLLKENFEEHIEYKILNSKEFLNISKCQTLALDNTEINNHNKVKHLIVLPDCFKESLMLLKTEKSKNIKKYYVEIEKIFNMIIKDSNLLNIKIFDKSVIYFIGL